MTAHSTWAMSTATSACDVVPFGVETSVVVIHGAALVGATRFWKKPLDPAPLGKRCSSSGRSRVAAMNGSSTAR